MAAFSFSTRARPTARLLSPSTVSSSDPNVASSTERVLLTITHPLSNHNGGMIAFGFDGYLYIGVGDGGGANDPNDNAQNVNVLLGKILRIDVNAGLPYSSPSTNPFFGATAGRDEIFAFGFRNPWRFSFDRVTGQQWVADVGQGTREEVDTPIRNGGNYGWRVFEGNFCTGLGPAPCIASNYEPPVFDYDTHAAGRCSVTGGYVYKGSLGTLPTGTYVYGDYCSGEILAWDGTTHSLLADTTTNISSFGEDEQGELYVVALGGTVSKIVSTTPCTFSISPARATFTAGGGDETVAVTAPSGCAWTAASNATWITITQGASGAGNGTVHYTVAPYTGKPKNRNGSMTIAGLNFAVKQSK